LMPPELGCQGGSDVLPVSLRSSWFPTQSSKRALIEEEMTVNSLGQAVLVVVAL
jgi:hypothetical protein